MITIDLSNDNLESYVTMSCNGIGIMSFKFAIADQLGIKPYDRNIELYADYYAEGSVASKLFDALKDTDRVHYYARPADSFDLVAGCLEATLAGKTFLLNDLDDAADRRTMRCWALKTSSGLPVNGACRRISRSR